MEGQLAVRLRDYASSLEGREQYAANAFADAIESLPAILAENGGLDPIDVLVSLRSAHTEGKTTYGVDLDKGKVADMKKSRIIEPAIVKKQVIASASEAAQMLLKIDDVISSKGGGMPGGPGGEGDFDEE